ncbi:hypothetical protein HDC91_001299 [Mucilaginibacter sp. AK015]|nr:hypothetical protein [Mucilaginibacter sp. AK015]
MEINKITNSQVADRQSSISGSQNANQISMKRVRSEAAIISLVVGILSSVIATYIYEHFLK